MNITTFHPSLNSPRIKFQMLRWLHLTITIPKQLQALASIRGMQNSYQLKSELMVKSMGNKICLTISKTMTSILMWSKSNLELWSSLLPTISESLNQEPNLPKSERIMIHSHSISKPTILHQREWDNLNHSHILILFLILPPPSPFLIPYRVQSSKLENCLFTR